MHSPPPRFLSRVRRAPTAASPPGRASSVDPWPAALAAPQPPPLPGGLGPRGRRSSAPSARAAHRPHLADGNSRTETQQEGDEQHEAGG